MSKSALRLLALVVVLGGAFVGTLTLFGTRALNRNHRAVSSATAASEERASANRAHARQAEE